MHDPLQSWRGIVSKAFVFAWTLDVKLKKHQGKIANKTCLDLITSHSWLILVRDGSLLGEVVKMLSKLATKSLLIVDDEKDIADIISSELTGLGVHCHKANSMKEALSIAKSEQIDGILTDVRMPLQSGVDLLKAVREMTTTIPVILMTGYSDLKIPLAYHLGAELMMSKPFDLDELGSIFEYYATPIPERWESKSLTPELYIADLEDVVFGRGGILFLKNPESWKRPKVGESKIIHFETIGQTFSVTCRWHYGEQWGVEITAWDNAMKNKNWSHLSEIPFIPFNA